MASVRGATVSASGARRGHSGIVIMLVGVFMIVLWLIGFMMQVTTNEAFLNNSVVNGFKPDWTIFMQIPNLLMGNLSGDQAGVVMFGWGVEAFYIAFLVGYEIFSDSIQSAGRALASIFMTLSWIVVGFGFWTDFNYGTFGSGLQGHIGFSIITSLVVGTALVVGIAFIKAGYQRL